MNIKARDISLTVITLIVAAVALLFSLRPAPLNAQTDEEKGKRKLFEADTEKYKDQRSKAIDKYMASEKAPAEEVEFKASSIEVLKDTNQIKGSQGVVISGHNVQVQADDALYNSETKEAQMQGNIHITGDLGMIEAKEGKFNIESETGDFDSASFMVENGAYEMHAEKLNKLSEFEFNLDDTYFSTCQCKDCEQIPWRIRSDRCLVTQESYAHCRGSRLEMYGTPVLYTPYFVFPVKTERASGLLPPTLGYSDEDGFEYRQPLFLVLDDYSDATVIPFTENRTRAGGFLDYRHAFSEQHTLSTRVLYSDERARGDSLRGSDVSEIKGPRYFDEDRFGGLYRQRWTTEKDALIPAAFIADGHYVSDELLLKEIDDNGIDLRNTRYVTSTAVFRVQPLDFISAELLGEYNQSMLTASSPQDRVFQRAPEFRVNALKSWRPLGYNPFGIKLVTKSAFDLTQFTRTDYYEGERIDFNPGFSIPIRYQNYFNSSIDVNTHVTQYHLTNQLDPDVQPDGTRILWNRNPSRTVPTLSYTLGSGIERVYRLDPDSWLADLTNIGATNQGSRLARLKHTIEPTFMYRWVPKIDQNDIAEFDQLDRIRQKSIVLYGLTSRIYGRFLPQRGTEETLPEITPEIDELPEPVIPSLLEDLGGPRLSDDIIRPLRTRRGTSRALMTVSLLEGYNILEAKQNQNPDRNAFTDMTGILAVEPTDSLSMDFSSTYDREHQKFTSWEATGNLKSDRGDSIMARYSFVDKSANPYGNTTNLSQLQAGVEAVLGERYRFGYFTRFDSPSGTFIDNMAAIRISSACNCWYLDLGYSQETNPNREKYLVSFTFGGLGGITQAVPYMGYRSRHDDSGGM